MHVHDCFDEQIFFDSALANLEIAAGGHGWLGCILFTEAAGEDVFADLKGRTGAQAGAWRFHATAEDCSLIARRHGQESRVGEPLLEESLVVVAGRQILTAERVEVLALGTTAALPDGRPLPQTLAAVRAAGALPVLPWGFGKWLGRRGRLVAQAIAAARPGELFLGDNGGRPAWSPRPRLFARAEASGVAVLPGSDPLPIAQEVGKVARYGFVLAGGVDPATPWVALRRALTGLTASPRPFGRLERLPAFVHRQLAMQVRKRLGSA